MEQLNLIHLLFALLFVVFLYSITFLGNLNIRIEFKAGRRNYCFSIIPTLEIEHKPYKGFAIVVGWGHYLAGVRFFKTDN